MARNYNLRQHEFFGIKKCELWRTAWSYLYQQLEGRAKFHNLEGWLKIELAGDRLGHITAKCELRDEPGIGNQILFTLEMDQTDVPEMLASLKAIAEQYPVVGRT